jgi:AcrR family transcriptional regulator
VAYELFAERGYHGTSVREIAHRAGMSQGQITYHFGSKAALFRAVATDARAVLDTVARDASIAGDATRRLATVTEQVAQRTEARQAVTAPDPAADDGRSPGE